jgi:Flp pilus assembly protein TadD
MGPERCWRDAAWREHRLNETYHLLCAQPQAALPDALHETVHACRHSTETLRRWVQVLAQAGRDTDSRELADLARRLQAGDDDQIAALTVLLASRELPTAGRALAYTTRGRAHRTANKLEQALADYNAAQQVDPELWRVYSGRGVTYRALGRYEEALVDLIGRWS